MARALRQEGFSLIELMIAVLILGVVTTQVFMVFNTQKRVYTANERVLDVQEDSRTVLDLVALDARMAGFMVPRFAGISSRDGGNGPANATDTLCISDASYFDFVSGVAGSDGLDNRNDHFDAAVVNILAGNTATVASLNVDNDNGPNDFGIGRGLILSDGQFSHCARITDIQGNNITFDVGPPAFGAPGALRATPAVIYELNEATLTLTRNGLTLATGIEDLQVEYWVDNATNPPNGIIDGANEFPVHNLTANNGPNIMDPSAIRRVRISVVARTDQIEYGVSQQYNNRRRPASANRAQAAAADSFARRRFTTSVLPRNLL